mmetsp:Transcript_139284/g.445300  ORF Transcript_139284/g.445300 Transcript_139284/m.445300 type:complete len:345 (+) Transcript_139284:101-1135(+)
MNKAFRRFKWSDLPKRKRQLAIAGFVTTSFTAVFNYKFRECVEIVGNPAQIQNPNTLFWLRMRYGRARSRWFGSLAELHVPVAFRQSLYSAWAWKYDANLDEVRYPLDSFGSCQDFFCRALKEGARPIDHVPAGVVSPVDGTVMSSGFIEGPGARLEQVKGATYSVPSFLGFDPIEHIADGSTLCYIVLYLAPGDYHRIHAPCSLDFRKGSHFCGELLPMRPSFVSRFSDVFSVNERLVLTGSWKQGQMNLVAVAAQNVGSIYLDFDEKLKTNRLRDIVVHCGGDVSNKRFVEPIHLDAGDALGGFRMGSTVALIFEASPGFQWDVAQGDRVQVGKKLGEASGR